MPEVEETQVGTESPVTQVPATKSVPVSTLEADMQALKARLEQVETSFKSTQRILSQREKDVDSLKRDLRDAQDLKEQITLLTAAVAQGKGQSEEELETDLQTNKPSLLSEVTRLDQERKSRRAQEDYNQRANEIWTRAQALGKETDDGDVLDIEAYLRAGQLASAETKLKKLEKASEAAKPKDVSPVDTEKLIHEKAEQMFKAELQKRGLLTSDTGEPGGAIPMLQQVRYDYAVGKISAQQYAEKMKQLGQQP